jgi:tetratricopeptide (TPR) repeat protein
MLVKFSLSIGIFLWLVFSSGCIWSARAPDDSNENTAPVSQPLQQYSDAAVALADGIKFLDTGEIDNALDALSQAVKLDPYLAEAWFRLGIAYALVEKRDQEREMVREEEDNSDPKKPTKTNSEKAFEKAVATYKKIVAANDQDHLSYYNLGRAYNKLNEDEDAAKALKQAVKLNPEDTEYQTELGSILIKLAQYHEAIQPLKKAIELDPDNIRAQELLEDAEAGRKRINYSSTPKEDKRRPGESPGSGNTNTSATPSAEKTPPPPPTPRPVQPRPSPGRPSEN